MTVGRKLFLLLVIVTAMVVTATVFFMNWSFEQGFFRFIEMRQQDRINAIVTRLESAYARDGGWARLAANRRLWDQALFGEKPLPGFEAGPPGYFRPPHPPPHFGNGPPLAGDPPPPPRGAPPQDMLENRVMLLNADRGLIYGDTSRIGDLALHPIRSNRDTVGYLGVLPGPLLSSLGEVRFLEQQTRSFVVIAVAMCLLCALLAVFLARRISRPLRAFRRASQQLAGGKYETRIAVESKDEFGQLARDFNELAMTLENNETARRRWVADISHELRTPLSVLRGEIEALQDGLRPLDAKAVESLHGETMRLTRLVGDLYELSMSDIGAMQYRKVSTDPVAVLRDDLEQLATEFENGDISVTLDAPRDGAVVLQADPDRLSQLFRNLLNNSLRHTDAPGTLDIRVRVEADKVLFEFEDSAPGVSARDLPKLFERFYRTSVTRDRAIDGAGLGLAICRNIVDAHGGRIWASSASSGGLGIRIELPYR